MSSLSRSLFRQRTAGSDATRLDTTMLVFTGSRERTESEYQHLLHRAGLRLVKTTTLPHHSALSRPHLPKTDSG
jgi:Lhr-like helicase